MKNTIIIFPLTLIFLLAACGGDQIQPQESERNGDQMQSREDGGEPESSEETAYILPEQKTPEETGITVPEMEIQTIVEDLKKDGNIYAGVKIEYPRLKDGPEEINEIIMSGVMADMGSFRGFMEEIEYDTFFGPGIYENKCEAIRLDEKIFSVLCGIYIYTGGAHPNTYSGTFNFDMRTGKKISISDLLTEGGLQRVAMFSKEQLQAKLGAGLEETGAYDEDWIKEGTAAAEENYQAFTLGENALTIYFDPYTVAPYAAGPQKVEIPYASIEDVLKSDL